MSFDVATHSEADTIALGKALGPVLSDGDVLALRGDLGAGKTLFRPRASPRAWALTTSSSVRPLPS